MIRALLFLVLVCLGCQSGRIPCPKFKTAKSVSHKRYRQYSSTLTAKAEKVQPEQKYRKTDPRYVQNVDVEDWDCPQPGSKKYLPRSVKENIRRNARKVRDDARQTTVDSLSSR